MGQGRSRILANRPFPFADWENQGSCILEKEQRAAEVLTKVDGNYYARRQGARSSLLWSQIPPFTTRRLPIEYERNLVQKNFFFFTSFRARGPRKDEKRERWMASRENVLFQRKCFEIMLKSHGNLIGIDRLKKKAQHFKVFSTKKIRTNIDNNNYIGQLFLAVTTSFVHRKVLFCRFLCAFVSSLAGSSIADSAPYN